MFQLIFFLTVIQIATAHICFQGTGSFLVEDLMATEVAPLYEAYMAKYGKNVALKFTRTFTTLGYDNLKFNSNSSKSCPIVFSETDYPNDVNDSNFQEIPLFSQALVIIYNLKDTTPLNLSLSSVADIYLGDIFFWNDTLINVTLNPTMNLPHKKIIPVAQAEPSASTYLFTNLLSDNDEIWRADYGAFYSPNFTGNYCCESNNWPPAVKYFGQTISGMVGLVSSIPYAIGYATLPSLKGVQVRQAVLVTGQNYTPTYPDSASVQKTITYIYSRFDPPSFQLNLSVDDSSVSYPLIAINYFSVNLSYDNVDCDTVEQLAGFLHWFFFIMDPQVLLHNQYVPLIQPMVNQIQKEVIEKITCKGQNMYKRYVDNLNSFSKLDTWTTVVIILACTIGVGAICVAIYILHTQRKQAILQWMIDPEKCQLIGLSMLKSPSPRSGSMCGDRDRLDQKSTVLSFDQVPERCYIGKERLKHIFSLGEFDNKKVFLNAVPVKPPSTWNKKTKVFVTKCKTLAHKNIAHFLGVTLIHGRTNLILEYYAKGTLHYVLHTCRYHLSETILFHLAYDVACGLNYLHHAGIVHGHLNSLNCLVDASWTVHVGQWVECLLMTTEAPTILKQRTIYHQDLIHEEEYMIKMLYLDPAFDGKKLSPSADVYSFGMLLYEVFTRQLPFIKNIGGIRRVLYKKFVKKSYPIPEDDDNTMLIPKEFIIIANQCLRTEPDRPALPNILTKMSRMTTASNGIVDIMMDTMESYADTLEDKVQERTIELKELNERMKDLLHEVLPPPIAEKLFNKEPVEPEFFQCVSIYFSDICGFTSISARSTPTQVMNFLNNLWLTFDRIIGPMDVYKVDTIGDAYMVCSGLPERNEHFHVKHIADLALALLNECTVFKIPHLPDEQLQIRIGINSGPVTAGIVGSKMPQYCVFGDTVNTAARMESTGLPMKIQLSGNSQKLLDEHFNGVFKFEYRGQIHVKGKGSMETYWLINDRRMMSRNMSMFEEPRIEVITRYAGD